MSTAIVLSLQVYALAIVIAMSVALLIKGLVLATQRIGKPKKKAAPTVAPRVIPVASTSPPPEVVAAITAALSIVSTSYRILHITESSRAWSHQGRSAQHSHQPVKH